MEIKNSLLVKKLFTYALGLCAIFEFIIIQYFNIFEAKEHLGIDSSWEYLKAIVLTKEGGIFPTNVLSESTSPGTDKICTIISPLNRIIDNVWISFGIGTMIITIITIIVLWALMGNLKLGIMPKLIVINLFLCPYLANGFDRFNDLGYFSCSNGIPSYENTIILLMFLSILIISYNDINPKRVILIAVVILLYLFKGLTSGVSVVMFCGTPAVLYILAKVFLNNNIKEFISWKSLFLLLVNVAIIIGRFIGGCLGYSYGESAVNWTTAPEFFENLQHEFLGYMLLVGAVPGTGAYRSPFSFYGMGYIFGLIIFVVMVISVIYSFIKFIKKQMWKSSDYDVWLLGFSTIAIVSLEFGLLKTNAAQDIFETRYLITALLFGFIFIGLYIQQLDDALLFKHFGVVVLAAAIVGMNLYSDYIMAVTDNKSFHVAEVQEIIGQTDAGLVYFWENGKDTLPTYEVIRVTDIDRVYKSVNDSVLQTYGQYKYYDDSTEYVGPTVLVIEEDDSAPSNEILARYNQIGVVNNMGIYYCKDNPIDLKKISTNKF